MSFESDVRSRYELALDNLALVCVIELTPHLGRPPSEHRIAETLTVSARALGLELYTLSTYGALAGWRKHAVARFVRGLVERGLLQNVGSGARRGVVLTAAGRRAVFDGEEVASPARQEVKPPMIHEPDCATEQDHTCCQCGAGDHTTGQCSPNRDGSPGYDHAAGYHD